MRSYFATLHPTAFAAIYHRSILVVHRLFHQNLRSLNKQSDARINAVFHHLVAISLLTALSRAVRPPVTDRCSITVLHNAVIRAAHPVYQHLTLRLATETAA